VQPIISISQHPGWLHWEKKPHEQKQLASAVKRSYTSFFCLLTFCQSSQLSRKKFLIQKNKLSFPSEKEFDRGINSLPDRA